MHLTKSEQQIMEIFWQADHPMAQPVISNDTATHTLKNPAIRRFMEYLPF